MTLKPRGNDEASSKSSDLVARFGVVGEFLRFLWERKLYWLLPMIIALSLLSVLIVFGSNPTSGPLIYTLF